MFYVQITPALNSGLIAAAASIALSLVPPIVDYDMSFVDNITLILIVAVRL